MPANDHLRETARSLRLDKVASEVGAALGRAGIRSIVLKGPALQRLLYADGALRAYNDIDLLVAPRSMHPAGAALEALGFKHFYSGETAVPEHAESWARSADGAVVDLHWTLVGVGARPEKLWAVLGGATETIVVGGMSAEALDPPATALAVALHAAQHGPANRRSLTDLKRALALLEAPTWHAAATIARTLEAEEMFAAGLRLLPEGSALADTLGLSALRSVETTLQAESAGPLALGFQKLATTPGLRGKLTLVARELVPSRRFMAAWWAPAARGPLWMALAYGRRLPWILWHAGPAFIAWRRATQESRRLESAAG